MKKSKLLLTLLMAGLMATSVAGLASCSCGGSEGDDKQNEQEKPDDGENEGGGNEGGGNEGGGNEGGNEGGGNEGGGNEGGGNEGGGNEGGGNEGGGDETPVTPSYTLATDGSVNVTLETATLCEANVALTCAAGDFTITATGASVEITVASVNGVGAATTIATLNAANNYTATITVAANQALKVSTMSDATFTLALAAEQAPPAVDPEAPEEPVITIDGQVTEINATLNQAIAIPNATVTDNKALDDIYLEIGCNTGATLEGAAVNEAAGTITGGTFISKTLGDHVIDYVAIDAEGNETWVELIVHVTSDTYAETASVTGYNSLNNLTTDGGTFKENFEKGTQSPLVAKAAAGIWEIEAGANAINGNSMVIDYAANEGKENRVFLNTIPLMTGKWTVSFDVKLISGTGFEDFYVGFVKDGTVSSDDQQKPLSGMTVGETRRITWENSITLDDGGTYYFHFFRLNQTYSDNGCVMAFDNFEFTYAPPALELPTTTPTFDQLKAGYTYDWETTYMPIGGAELIPVTDITNAEAKAAIQGASSGFSANVQHLTGSGAHNLTVLTKENIPDMFQTGWTYYLEFDYYCVAHGSPYLIAYDGTSANHTIASDIFPISNGAVKHVKIPYTVAAADNALTLYSTATSGMDIYLGNFKITGEAPVENRTDFHNVTNAEMQASGGYTYDWSTNNILEFSGTNVSYMKVENLTNPALVSALDATGAYTSGYAMRYQGTSSALVNGMAALDSGYIYTVTVKVYDMGGLSNLLLLPANNSVEQVDGIAYKFSWTQDSTGLWTGVATLTPPTAATKLNFYAGGSMEAYFASINIQMKKVVAGEYMTPTAAEFAQGVTFTPEYGYRAQFSANVAYEEIASMSNSGLISELQNFGRYSSGYSMAYKGSGVAYLNAVKGMVAGKKITVTIEAYNMGGIENFHVLMMDASGQQAGDGNQLPTSNYSNETHTYTMTVSFTAVANATQLCLYAGGQAEIHMASISITIA